MALVLLFLTKPLAYLPKATLGAVIVAAAVGSHRCVDAWKGLARTVRFEVVIAAITTIAVLALGVLNALAIAVVLSILDVVRRSADPHDAVLGWVESIGRYADVKLHPSARVTPGVLVYRLDDRLFFANSGLRSRPSARSHRRCPRRRSTHSSSMRRPSRTSMQRARACSKLWSAHSGAKELSS